ncbi:hypothetical protein MKX01_033733 [Papaver californicum]|nr:hypothetical protein MKX01_033733 [Papaver californicum]
MEGGCIDFLVVLNSDLSFKILSNLNNPADVVRVSSVSRSWRQFVIASEFSKSLCFRLFPETSSAIKAIEENIVIESSLEFETIGRLQVEEKAKKNHRIYALLARGLGPCLTKDCILEAISASSREDSIHQTLVPGRIFQGGFSFWSSTGMSNPEVPETLTYRLVSKLCFITEINIQPFQDGFGYNFPLGYNSPIYSAKAVRFRIGHVKEPQQERYLMGDYGVGSIENHVVWTYTSEKFPMVQESCLQKIKLPEPVLAIGGLLQIELLGRVQIAWDGLYYLCVSHVQVVGHPLTDDFIAELNDHSGKCVLKYNPETATCNYWG